MTESLVDRRPGLPAELTTFIGRGRELAEIGGALEQARLVTLCGPGGVGKSRLALRAATLLRDSYRDGACFVELSALRRPELLARAVADALHLPDQSAGDPLDLLADRLADRTMLLVLDTCEHLVDACAMLAEVLLRAAPGLRIIATSRESLDVMGERTLQVAPLDTPGPDGADCDSVRLFADRAAAMVHGFALTRENRPAVARLCRRLDGIPLAIELAAVRLRVMSAEQIVARLDDRFRLLGTARAGRDRHQTLRAAVEWSHDLCTPAEQSLWARLAVFPGGFDLEAAERICHGPDLAAGEVLDVLGRLVEKSVVLCEDGGRRYRMLDTIREYGAERLAGPGEHAELQRRHRDHYFALAAELMPAATGERQIPTLSRVRTEYDNLRVALDHALATPGDEHEGLRLANLLKYYWLELGLFGEAGHWYGRALAASTEPSAERGWACNAAGIFAVLQGDLDTARPLLEEARESADRHGDDRLATHILVTSGRLALYAEDLPDAVALHQQAREAFERIGDASPYALANYMLLASALLFSGEVERALEVCEEGLAACREQGELWSLSFTQYVRGGGRWLAGDPDGAQRDALAALRTKEEFGDLFGITVCLDLLAACAVSHGECERSAELIGATQRLWRDIGVPYQLGPYYALLLAQVQDDCQKGMSAKGYAAALERGAALTVEQAIAFARGTEPAVKPDATGLSKREEQVADLVAEGLTNREIAERLVIAKRTVDSHLEHILAKLGYSSRTQIAVWAERRIER